MKIKIVSVISGVALLSGLVISPVVLASNSADVTKALAGSTALELSAKAANLVAKASATDQKDVAIAVVKTAVGMNPSAVVAVVSAIVRENPATAATVAVAAATEQPKRIGQIAKAAAAAAPTEAVKIVAALLKEFPRDYGVIATGAAEGAPAAGRAILAEVGDYVPALQASIQGASAHYSANGGNMPVQAILMQSYDQALSSGAAVTTQVPASLAANAGTLVSQGYDSVAFGGGAMPRGTLSTPMAFAPNMPAFASVPMPMMPLYSSPVLSGVSYTGPLTGSTPPSTSYDPGQTTTEAPGPRNYSLP